MKLKERACETITGKKVYIPVKNFEKAKEWYGRILGLNKGEKQFNHLFAAETPAYQTPAIQFVTNNLQASFQYMKAMKLIL